MFRKLRLNMKRRVARRADPAPVRGVLERLEERLMLSAHGLMNYGRGGQDFGPRKEAGSRFSDSIGVAWQQQRSVSYDTQIFASGPGFGNPDRELQFRPPMQMDS